MKINKLKILFWDCKNYEYNTHCGNLGTDATIDSKKCHSKK